MSMAACVFCGIARGDIPACTVYDDGAVIAFMDRNPINAGHVLVIPKVHQEHFHDLSEALYCRVLLVARRVAHAVAAIHHPKKVGFAVAGFDVPHAHVHIVPMHHYHDLTSAHHLNGTLGTPSTEELEQAARSIRERIAQEQ